ncbi:putative nuclease HARBI1, partial [Clarias magur]
VVNSRSYSQINPTVPVLQLYFDGKSDTRPDFRLCREALNTLLKMLPEKQHMDGAKIL